MDDSSIFMLPLGHEACITPFSYDSREPLSVMSSFALPISERTLR